MLKSNHLFCSLLLGLLASVRLMASGGLDDNFSGYPAGTKVDHLHSPNDSAWVWYSQSLSANEGSIEIQEEQEGQKFLKVDLPFPASGVGNWRLLCELNQPLETDGDRKIKFQISMRIPDFQFPMDFVAGVVVPDRSEPLSLGADHLQSIFRFLVNPGAQRTQFFYVSHPAGSEAERPNYHAVPSFEVVEGEWYDITVVLNPKFQSYDLQVSTKDAGTVFEISDVPWVRESVGIAGLAFKNRTTNDLRSARLDIRQVVLDAPID